jgi:hypothetical protein
MNALCAQIKQFLILHFLFLIPYFTMRNFQTIHLGLQKFYNIAVFGSFPRPRLNLLGMTSPDRSIWVFGDNLQNIFNAAFVETPD